jgi:hypothetical protein
MRRSTGDQGLKIKTEMARTEGTVGTESEEAHFKTGIKRFNNG